MKPGPKKIPTLISFVLLLSWPTYPSIWAGLYIMSWLHLKGLWLSTIRFSWISAYMQKGRSTLFPWDKMEKYLPNCKRVDDSLYPWGWGWDGKSLLKYTAPLFSLSISSLPNLLLASHKLDKIGHWGSCLSWTISPTAFFSIQFSNKWVWINLAVANFKTLKSMA